MPDSLISVSYWTLAGVLPGSGLDPRWSLQERAAAAAQAGFRGVGFVANDYRLAREGGASDAELRAVLAGHDLRLVEIEFVSGWSADDAAVRERARQAEDDLYRVAAAFGVAPNLNVGCSEPVEAAVPLDQVIERFAALCDRAAVNGLRVALEFMPWTGIPDVAIGWQVVEAAGRSNGGLLLDTWHYFRGAADPAPLRQVPPERLFCVQINDAAPDVVGTLREDTLRRRRLPGQGSFDLQGLIGELGSLGVDAPYAVEVMSEELSVLPLDQAARRAFETTAAVLG